MVAQRGRDDSRKKMFLKSLFGRQALAPSLEAEEASVPLLNWGGVHTAWQGALL